MLDTSRLLYIGAGALFWLWFTQVCAERICSRVSNKLYKALSEKHQIQIRSGLTTTIYSFCVSVVAVYAFWFDDQIQTNRIWGYTWRSEFCLMFVVSYIVADTYLLTRMPSVTKLMYQHHFVVVALVLGNMVSESCAYFGVARTLSEISSPFVCSRYFLGRLQIASANFRQVTAILAFVLFMCCRVLSLPWYYAQVYDVFNTEDYNRMSSIPTVIWLVGGGMLDWINLTWFSMMLPVVFKSLVKRKNIEL